MRLALAVTVGLSIAINAPAILGEYLAVSPGGTDTLRWMTLLAILPLLLAFGAAVILTPFIAIKKTRPFAWKGFVSVSLYSVIGMVCFALARQVRMYGMRQAAGRAQPLVAAIVSYERAIGHPPATLRDLVPQYLPAVPDTGLGAYPRFEYKAQSDTSTDHFGNTWILYVDTPSGPINWDMLLYLPNQQYPKSAYGGYLERLGRWAYVHE